MGSKVIKAILPATKRVHDQMNISSSRWTAMNRREFTRSTIIASGFCGLLSKKGIPMSRTQMETDTETGDQTVRHHQPGQGVFKAIVTEDVNWQPFPAFPPSVRLAIVVGEPSLSSPYVIRVKVPRGVKLMPHKHLEDRVYTVISGVFYIGLGNQFDADKLQAYSPGSVIVLPGNTAHFHWAKSGEYISQVNAIGPLGLEYVDPKDDPRNGNSR